MSARAKVKINLNDSIYFRLTDKGHLHVREQLAETFAHLPLKQRVMLVNDCATAYDRGKTQIHDFMHMFGPVTTLGFDAGALFVDGLNFEVEASA